MTQSPHLGNSVWSRKQKCEGSNCKRQEAQQGTHAQVQKRYRQKTEEPSGCRGDARREFQRGGARCSKIQVQGEAF